MRSSRRTINLCTGFGNRRCFTDKIECKREWHYIHLVEGAKARPTSANPSETTKACINNRGLYRPASKSLSRSAFLGSNLLSFTAVDCDAQ
jgi:hypothetical protein